MLLSESPLVGDYLGQFKPADVRVAATLLDTLHVVSFSRFERTIRELVRVAAAEHEGPYALYSVRDSDPVLNTEKKIKRDRRGRPILHPLFVQSDTPPSFDVKSGEMGSEGRTAHLATSIGRENSTFLANPSLDALRTAKVRTVIMLDDLIGSGTRTSRFLRAFTNHKTIHSWMSYGLLNICVVAYAATKAGVDVVKSAIDAPVDVRYERVAGNNTGIPSIEEIEGVLRTYSTELRSRERKIPLGYRDSFVLMVFAHSCPNNAPPVLWARSPTWRGLFPGRSVPPELAATFDDLEDAVPHARVLEFLRLRDIGKLQAIPHRILREIGLTLAACERRPPDLPTVAAWINVGLPTAQRLVDLCARAKLLQGLRLTQEGRSELGYLRQHARSAVDPYPDEDLFYFPTALREVRASSSTSALLPRALRRER